ncbi:hypothetical protein VPNG_07932 [Cytospora leucostoma]|uniref:Uncharacterized protein n=1 Tax=Cytospora leucostoma TaxID=1230097 RepID=A0A423WAN9_9PEZI|nr:hypothetical protein VPNG_07932 [Cytospora leucostoma]
MQTGEEAVHNGVLFRLPGNIRNDIYKLVLAPTRAARWEPRGNSFPGDALPLDRHEAAELMGWEPAYIGLLQSCKQLHDEASSLLYNTVEMHLHKDRKPEQNLLKLGTRHLKYIRNITIEFRHHADFGGPTEEYETNEGTIGAWRAATILGFLRQAGATLYTVTLKAPWHKKGCSGMYGHVGCPSLEPLLRDPSIFSRVQNVVFPDHLALCPPRNLSRIPARPLRNRPLTQANKAEIVSRLGFQVEVAQPGNSFDRSIAPFSGGFFVIKNPQDVFQERVDILPVTDQSEWMEKAQEYLAHLESYGIVDYSPIR